MNDDMMHGFAAIAATILLLIYVPLLARYTTKFPAREWLVSQPWLMAFGLTMESCGVLMISAYRTAQLWFIEGLTLADTWTTVSLALVFGGGVVLVRAATLEHGIWKWRLLLTLCACWLTYALVWAS